VSGPPETPVPPRAADAPPDRRRRLRRAARGALLRLVARRFGDGSEPLPDLRAARRVLLVCVNQRLGNTLVATAGLAAIAKSLPDAELSFVGGAPAPAVLRGFGLARLHVARREDTVWPWRLWRLLRTLRRERYDVAVHLSTATRSSGALIVAASGARHRIGVRRAEGGAFFSSAVEPSGARHKVDELLDYVRRLGLEADGERTLALSADERAEGAARLRSLAGEGSGGAVALFVGARARKGKAWPLAAFASVAAGLRAHGLTPLVFLGPEELAREAEVRAALGDVRVAFEPDVRRVGALLSACRAVLSPDAGPMHLAIAAGAPTVAVFARSNFDRWGPRPPRGVALYDPDGTRAGDALDALLKAAAGIPFEEARHP
jgi:ADP-heptose:LPS heptosyltransferase